MSYPCYKRIWPIVAHNTNRQPYMDAVFVANNGDIKAKLAGSDDWVTFQCAEKSVILPMMFEYIHTDTSATIFGLDSERTYT